MLRQTACIVLLMAFAPAAYAQQGSETPNMEPEAREARQTALVAKAEREARAGRLPEAALVYSDAFDLRRDPRVGGRLGVVLVQLDNAVVAADLLMNALERASDASPDERLEFFKAYEIARSRVCRLEVTVSEAHARISLDGRVTQPDGVTAFAMFVPPGEHELRAKLPGFRDAAVHLVTAKGATLEVALKLESEAPRVSVLPAARSAPSAVTLPVLRTSNIATDPNYSTKEDPFYEAPKPVKQEEKRGVRFSALGGIVTVFGVASWSPAVGGMFGGRLSPNEYASIGLEGRAAWLTSGVAGARISAMTAGGILSGCGHLKWFFGCALGHVGVLNIEFEKGSFVQKNYSIFAPGVGGRIGARFRLKSFVFEANGDVLRTRTGTKVAIDQVVIAEQPPWMFATQMSGGWEW